MSVTTLKEMLEEYFDISFGLSEPEQTVYHLICKYSGKVSPRLLALRQELRESARGAAKKVVAEMLSRPSSLLSLVKKDHSWGGSYLVVPFRPGDAK